MSAVARALKAEIAKLEKRVARLKAIIYAKPATRIIEIRREAAQIMEKHWPDHVTVAKLTEPLRQEEKRMFAIHKKQKNSIKLIDEQIDAEADIARLRSELYWEERKLA